MKTLLVPSFALFASLGAAAVAAADFTRICHSGEAAGQGRCPAQPALGSGADDWGCTRDADSSLVWELKTADGAPRDKDRSYTNFSADYDPSRTRGSATDAAGYVKTVNDAKLCGATDWRMPTRGELLSLVRLGGKGLALDEAWFPHSASKAAKSVYWAGSAFAGKADNAWGVDFSDGVAGDDNRSVYYAVRLVRGPVAAAPLAASSDGREVHDARTKLAWRRCVEGMQWNGSACAGTPLRFDWPAAQAHAKQQAGWRVPTLQELASIVDDRRVEPAADAMLFPGTPSAALWTATASADGGPYQWQVQFRQGQLGNHAYRSDRLALRLVRELK
jgi:hypothetical protein